jgi:hypothetical protein
MTSRACCTHPFVHGLPGATLQRHARRDTSPAQADPRFALQSAPMNAGFGAAALASCSPAPHVACSGKTRSRHLSLHSRSADDFRSPLQPLGEAPRRSRTHKPSPLPAPVQRLTQDAPTPLTPGLRPRPLVQRPGPAQKPNPSLQFVSLRPLASAEIKTSSSSAAPVARPKRRRPPVPRPAVVNANIRKILVDGTAVGGDNAVMTPSEPTFCLGDHALCQAYILLGTVLHRG